MKRFLFWIFLTGLMIVAASFLSRKKPASDAFVLPESTTATTETEARRQPAPKALKQSGVMSGSTEESARTLREVEDAHGDDRREKNASFDRATLFEAELSRSDVAKITENHPGSFFRRAGFFTTQSMLRGKCTKAEYESLKRKLPLETIHERGSAITELARMYDQRHLSDYIRKVRASWSEDARWREFRDLDAYYAHVSQLHEQMRITDAEYEERKARHEAVLIQAGVPKGDHQEYVLRTAVLSPPCLGQIHMDFLRWVRTDVTRMRGRYFLERLKRYWAKKRVIPSDFSKLVPSPGDPMRNRSTDGWNNAFRVKEANALDFLLYSVGEDGESGSEDDVHIGKFAR